MKKKLPKYQAGTQKGLDPVFDNSLWDIPESDINYMWGNVDPDNELLLNFLRKRRLGSKPAGQENAGLGKPTRTTQGEYATAAGFNLDPDGVYRKAEITENKNKQQYSQFFQALNPLLDLTQLIGNGITDIKNSEEERRRLIEARYMQPRYNLNEKGVNNIPVYLQEGGAINNTGYLKGASTANNPVNIIPSGNITTENMAFPIIANGIPLMPNTGDYQFDSNYVVEQPMQNGGSIVNYLAERNQDYSKEGRAKLAKKMGIKNYDYSAEKNLELLSLLQKSENPSVSSNVAKDPNFKNIGSSIGKLSKEPALESGMIIDKRKGELHIVIDGKIIKTNNVLTGKNVNSNTQPINKSTSDYTNADRVTPVGYYTTNPKNPNRNASNDATYQGNFTAMNPIAAFGVPAPILNERTIMGLHQTYDPAYRDQFYGSKNPYQSYGCVNCKKPDIEELFKIFPQGDTTRVIDTQTPEGKNYLKKYNVKQTGGAVQEVGSSDPREANAMLEQGEVFLTGSGQIKKVAETEDTHDAASGGSLQADVDFVLEDTSDKRKDKTSKALLVTPNESKALLDFKPKRSVSHSKLYEMVTEQDEKEFKRLEKKVENNIEYIDKLHGGVYAKNALDENLRLLEDFPTKGERFAVIYEHQQDVKQAENIDQQNNNKTGGMPKYQTGGSDRFIGKIPPYPNTWTNYFDKNQKKQYTAPSWITPEAFYGTPGLLDYMNTLNDFSGIDNDLQKADDTQWGYRHQAAYDKFFPNGQPVEKTTSPVVEYKASNTTPKEQQKQYQLPKPVQASTVNEGLGWSGGYGNVLGLINSFGRTPVNFEQLSYVDDTVHLEDPTPIINANTGDYNAAVAQLPQSGVGYANVANLQGQKYKVNNEAVSGVAGRNLQRLDNRDNGVAAANAQVDQINMQLRKQAETEVLVGKEKQRQQKFEYLNGIFTAIDNKNAFNRNANLALQLTPFFDANGNFNGQKYQINTKFNTNEGGRVEYIQDKITGQQFRVIYDRDGKIMSSSKVTTDNKAVGSKIR